jgi:hypothetical protein
MARPLEGQAWTALANAPTSRRWALNNDSTVPQNAGALAGGAALLLLSAYYHLDAPSVMASYITGNRHEFEL